MHIPVPPTDIRILVADDNTIVRDGLAAILTRQADMHVCAEASDGLEAIELFRVHRPDVTIMDMRMPRMDGASAIKAIREEFPLACILIYTTFDAEEGLTSALAAGAAGYLLKDTPRTDLLATIRALGAQQLPLPPPS